MFNVRIRFREDSPIYGGKVVIFENITEIHYNYENSGRIAFECEDTGYTYDIENILEFETF